MTKKFLREGGPLKTRHVGGDRYKMEVPLPGDSEGRFARECPNPECRPGYYKVKGVTGVTGGQEVAYCPYCRHSAAPNEFVTRAQLRYAKDVAIREAHEGVDRMVRDVFKLGPSGKTKKKSGMLTIETTYKPGPRKAVRRPYEEEVRRDLTCPCCGLDHSVFGLATWCGDCGEDIFLTHVDAEVAVIRSMLNDVDRRRDKLGHRVAVKDLENCLEDLVSVFEAVLKAFVRRYLADGGTSTADVGRALKKAGNAFQNPNRASREFSKITGFALLACLEPEEVEDLSDIFEKRNPITHNLGVVDRKYIERARVVENEGREIRVTVEEIELAISFSTRILVQAHSILFSASPS